MRRLRIAVLTVSLLASGFAGGFWYRSRTVPAVDLYLSDLQEQIDYERKWSGELARRQDEAFDRIAILERHLDATGK